MKTFLILFLAVTSSALANQTLPLFTITKDKNSNVVHYEAQLNDNCKLDRYKPVKIFWILEGKKTKDLSLLEKPLYNMDYDRKTENGISGQVMAFKNRKIPFELIVEPSKTNGICNATVKGKNPKTGTEGFVDSVRLTDFHGDSPKKVTITLRDDQGHKTSQDYRF